MITKQNSVRVRCLALVLVAALVCGAMYPASAEKIPRVLLAGDSWTGFLLAFRSYRDALEDRPGLERWVEVGNRTAIMGARVWELLEFPEIDYLNLLTNELNRFPNIDVVVITLGGNDILRGTKGVDPNNYNRAVRLSHCFDNDPAGEPWDSLEQCIEWMGESLEQQIGQVVDHILAVRPDIRVALLSYDYAAREPDEGYTIEDQHLAFLEVEMSKRNIALNNDRVEYVNNFGLMQYLYGIPEEGIEPGEVPPPCVAPEDPECTFWPGGNPAYMSPLMAYVDQDIHLTDFGYLDVANRSLDFCIEEWLNYPKALEILPLDDKSGPFYQFQVTFSHEVVGVTPEDFEVHVLDKGLLKSMSVSEVSPASGPADVYVVTVNMDGSQEAAYITVQDDDSITRADTGVPLGGPGVGNGVFVFNGLYEFVDMMPPDPADFYGAIQYLYMASEAYEYMLFGFSFDPEHFDANGDFLRDGEIDEEPYVIPGNAMLDYYEFALIKACLDNPDLDLSATGGLNATAVKAAWENNLPMMRYILGVNGEDPGLALTILPGLDTVMAGFYTLGDFNSRLLAVTLVSLLDQVDEFPFDFRSAEAVDENFTFFPEWLAYSGDASGNGWTNEQIYAYYAPDGVDAYVSAALNPNAVPRTGEGTHWEGRFLRLAVLEHAKWNSPWQWYRDGVPLEDDGRITGANRRNLDILSLQPGDTGLYTCDYVPKEPPYGDKSVETYGPINVVVTEGAVPAGGISTLSLIALALGAAGITAIRRKRRS